LDLFDDLKISGFFLFAGALEIRRQEKHIQLQCICTGLFELGGESEPFMGVNTVDTGNNRNGHTVFALADECGVFI
jgi:hypothetical protein